VSGNWQWLEAKMTTPRMSPRKLTASLAAGILVLALAATLWLALASIALRQPPVFSLVRRGSTEVRLEVDRSPDCPSGMLGMCDQGGTGPVYFSVWVYTSPTPNSRAAQLLLAIPVAP
jgi:hypothetical protein